MTDPADSTPNVGFVGLGNMGRPMLRRLVHAGYPARVFDVSPDAVAAVAAELDVSVAKDAADTATHSDVVVLMLPNSDVVEQVVLAGGLLDVAASGTLLIDMSSSEPERTQKLAKVCAQRGVTLIDAPVSGGVKGAEQGTLTIMVGADEAALARAQPVLAAFGSRVQHAGDVGSGHAVKALNNLMSATHLLSSSEAIVTGRRFGLDPAVVLEIVNGSSGRSASTENKWPNFVLTESYDTGFALGLMLKDMRIALDLAHSTGSTCGLSEAAVEFWSRAADKLGPAADHTEIARWVEASGTAGESE